MDDRFRWRGIEYDAEASPYLQHAREDVAHQMKRTIPQLVDRALDKLGDKLHDRVDDYRRSRDLRRTIAREIQTENRPEQWQHDKLVRETYADVTREIRERGGEILVRRDELWLKQQVGKRCVEVRDKHGALTDEDREHIAQEFHLKVVDGKIMIPDLQIWIRDRDGTQHLGNIELASGNYHRKLVQQKVRAGFHVVRGGDARGRRIRNGPEVVRNIIGR
jgi:hypothetical protein